MNTLYAIEHHAKDKADLVRELCFAFTTLLNPAGWQAKSVRGGAGSWMIYLPGTLLEFHFRDGGKEAITVRNSYWYNKWSKDVAHLTTRIEVWYWAKSVLADTQKINAA